MTLNDLDAAPTPPALLRFCTVFVSFRRLAHIQAVRHTYESSLKGAVQVRAVLSHQIFAGAKSDNFFADISGSSSALPHYRYPPRSASSSTT